MTLESIDNLPANNFHKLLAVRASGGSFVDGYVLSVIGVAMIHVSPALNLTLFWQGMIASSALFGIFFGGFLGGFLTDKLGRKLLFYVSPLIFMFFSFIQLWTTSGVELFWLRFILGIAVGIEYPVATSIMAELMPKKNRGPRTAAMVIFWFAGAALAYVAGQAILQYTGPDGWRYVLASTAVIGALLFLIRLGSPESPRWLMSKGRKAEADQVIKQIYGLQYGIENMPSKGKQPKQSILSIISSGYGKRMFFVSVFWTCAVIPVFVVYAFVEKVLAALRLDPQWASVGSIAITLLFVVGCVVATVLINRVGRRKLIIHSFMWSGLALLLLGFMDNANPVYVLAVFGFYAVAIGGAQILQLVYPSEIFPTSVRASAVGIGTSVSRIGAAIGTYLVPVSIQSIGIEHTMFFAAGITFIGLLVSVVLAPETKSLDLDDAASIPEGKRLKPMGERVSNRSMS